MTPGAPWDEPQRPYPEQDRALREYMKKALAEQQAPPIIGFGDPDFDAIIAMAANIMRPKSTDYTKGSKDKLTNFKEGAAMTGLTPRQVLGVYMHKHLSAVYHYINTGAVSSEAIENRIADCINYMLLLYKMVKEVERMPDAPKVP